jgi:hypothetical protein
MALGKRERGLPALAGANCWANERMPRKRKNSHCFFLAIQCKAKAGTRKRNTNTIRKVIKNTSISLPNSFSSTLKKEGTHDAQVFQKAYVTIK